MPTDISRNSVVQVVLPRDVAADLRARARLADRSLSAELRRVVIRALAQDVPAPGERGSDA